MLKKQTVWLLTMLSLMVVLSVYYLMSDQEDLAYVQRDEEAFPEEEFSPIDQEEQVEIENISTLGVSELFATLRMELEDERSLKKERLKDIIASSEATASEVNEAMNEINEIEKITSREKILQETILANYNNYEDVLV